MTGEDIRLKGHGHGITSGTLRYTMQYAYATKHRKKRSTPGNRYKCEAQP